MINSDSYFLDLFVIIECDNYGHFFQKATTRVIRSVAEPNFDQEFVIDLDGSQTLRIILYEEISGAKKPCQRGKASIELTRSWLKDRPVSREVPIAEVRLDVNTVYLHFKCPFFLAGKTGDIIEVYLIGSKYDSISRCKGLRLLRSLDWSSSKVICRFYSSSLT